MIRVTAKLICVLAGLYCVLALADRWGWTDVLWAECWPQVVLPRRPSPVEARTAELDCRLEAVRREIATIREERKTSWEKRRDLLKQLRERIGPEPKDITRLQSDNPVALALVRSVDAEDRRNADSGQKLADLEAESRKLEARRIAVSNGVSLLDPVESAGPSDGLRDETSESAFEERCVRIIREAENAKN